MSGLRVTFGRLSAPGGRWRPGRRGGWIAATAAGAVAVLAVGGIVIASGNSSGSTRISNVADNHAKSTTAPRPKKKPAPPLTLVSVTPSNGAGGVNGASPVTVTFSAPLAETTALPTLSPTISGRWSVSGKQAIFTPAVGYRPGTRVTVKIPAGMTSGAGAQLAQRSAARFTTAGQYSTLRLQQLLAQLGYLPLTWSPSSGSAPGSDANSQLSAAYDPPTGTFTFNSGYPTALTRQWSVGSNNMIIQGAVLTFEYDQGLTMDGIAGSSVWQHLFTAVAAQQTNKHGYTYVYVNQAGSERLTLWHNGAVRLSTLVNTGIAGRGTDDGTFPVYLRYQVTQMKGTNPDGTKYNDTVQWVSYFNGGDAVHYFVRPGYGYYQSLGCVELPYQPSVTAFNLMTYGTLVTVAGPVA